MMSQHTGDDVSTIYQVPEMFGDDNAIRCAGFLDLG